MTDDTTGIIGDRRRNPFAGFSDAEYLLFRAQMREEARQGAEEAITAHFGRFCTEHRERTESLETVVFGRRERGVVGLDQRMDIVEGAISRAARALWVAVSAIIVAVVGFLVSMLFGR